MQTWERERQAALMVQPWGGPVLKTAADLNHPEYFFFLFPSAVTSRRAEKNIKKLHTVWALEVLNLKIEGSRSPCCSPPLTLHRSSNNSDPVFDDSSSQVYFQGAPARITLLKFMQRFTSHQFSFVPGRRCGRDCGLEIPRFFCSVLKVI